MGDCGEVWAPWMGPPANEIGAALELRLMLIRTPALLIALNRFVVHSAGVLLAVAIRRRDPLTTTDSLDPFEAGSVGQRLCLSVRFADGREATTARERWNPADAAAHPPAPIVHGAGGFGGTPRRWDADLWLWPLPPPDALIFSCAWPAAGIAPTSHAIDADAILSAQRRVEILCQGGGGSFAG
jgi:hypothetical protein